MSLNSMRTAAIRTFLFSLSHSLCFSFIQMLTVQASGTVYSFTWVPRCSFWCKFICLVILTGPSLFNSQQAEEESRSC